MPRVIQAYCRYVDAFNRGLGTVVMYLIFVMIGVLLFASLTRYVLNIPFIWIIELSQFLMAAYWMLGGPYSLQLNTHVRMDVFYERWRPRTQGFWDSLTAFCMIFYLVILFRGGFGSTVYALEHGQRNYSAWAPLMWPIKAIMTLGIGLMILQAVSIFFKDLARFLDRDIA